MSRNFSIFFVVPLFDSLLFSAFCTFDCNSPGGVGMQGANMGDIEFEKVAEVFIIPVWCSAALMLFKTEFLYNSVNMILN